MDNALPEDLKDALRYTPLISLPPIDPLVSVLPLPNVEPSGQEVDKLFIKDNTAYRRILKQVDDLKDPSGMDELLNETTSRINRESLPFINIKRNFSFPDIFGGQEILEDDISLSQLAKSVLQRINNPPEVRAVPIISPNNITSSAPVNGHNAPRKVSSDSSSRKLSLNLVAAGQAPNKFQAADKNENTFNGLVTEIYQAETDADNGNLREISTSKLYTNFSSSSSLPFLATSKLGYLVSLVREIYKSSYFCEQLDIEMLLELYKPLQRSLSNANDLFHRFSPNVFNMKLLAASVSSIENSLKSGLLLMRIYLAPREGIQLQSDETFTLLIQNLEAVINKITIPLSSSTMAEPSLTETIIVTLDAIHHDLRELLNDLSEYAANGQIQDIVTTKLIYICSKIIFQPVVAKSIYNPKGLESLRYAAVKLWCTIFQLQRDKRSFIIEDILNNIDRLSVKRIEARKFYISNDVSIQLASALIMLLIQTSANVKPNEDPDRTESKDEFGTSCVQALGDASNYATEIMGYFVNKAMKTSKSVESSFRLILDFFVEDFLNVLYLPEWSSAELLVSCLANSLLSVVQTDRYGVMAYTMALELLGTIATGLYKLKNKEILIELSPSITKNQFNGLSSCTNHIMTYLDNKPNLHSSAASYFFTFYCSILAKLRESTNSTPELFVEFDRRMDIAMLSAKTGVWVETDKHDVDDAAATAAYINFLCYRPLAKYYDIIIQAVLTVLNHAKVLIRVRALRTISSLLETSPTIFALRPVQDSIAKRLSDESTQVRDVATDIVGKYIRLVPKDSTNLCRVLCESTLDQGVSVRKRSLKLLYELYPNVVDVRTQTEIADRIFRRLEDDEASVKQIASTFLTLLFLNPSDYSEDRQSTAIQIKDARHKTADKATTVLAAVQSRGDNIRLLVKEFFATELKDAQHKQLTKFLIHDMISHLNSQQDTLKIQKLEFLALLAQVDGSIFAQIQLKGIFDMFLRCQGSDKGKEPNPTRTSLLEILRYSVDKVGPLELSYLKSVQRSLIEQCSRIPLKDLSEAVPALWKVSVLLDKDDDQSIRTLARVAVSSLTLLSRSIAEVQQGKPISELPKMTRLSFLLGYIGRYCKLDKCIDMFKPFQPKGAETKAVNEIISRRLMVFCHESLPENIQRIGLRAIGNICITHNFMLISSAMQKHFSRVLRNEPSNDLLVAQVLNTFLEYFRNHAEEVEIKKAEAARRKEVAGGKIDLEVFHGKLAQDDGIPNSLGREYIKDIEKYALKSESDIALVAVLLIEAIAKQRIISPAIIATSLIALECSKRKDIAALAREVHTLIHSDDASLISGRYPEGIALAASYRAKLSPNLLEEYEQLNHLYGLIKKERRGRKRLFEAIGKSLDFDPSSSLQTLQTHLYYTIFLSNALSSIPFEFVDDIYTLIHAIDMLVSSTGVYVTHSVEGLKSGEPDKLKWSNVGYSCVILHILWSLRMFLRVVYNISEAKCQEFREGKLSVQDSARNISRPSKYSLRAFRTQGVDLAGPFTVDSVNMKRVTAYMAAQVNTPDGQNVVYVLSGSEDDENEEGKEVNKRIHQEIGKESTSPSKIIRLS